MNKSNNKEIFLQKIERRKNLLWKIREEEVQDIKIKENFINFLDKIEESDKIKEPKKIIYEKIFSILNRASDLEKKPDTSIITSMYDYSGMRFLNNIPSKKEISDFFKYIKEANIDFSSITWMQNKRWLPKLEELKEIVEICQSYSINFSSITSMQHGKWLPQKDELKSFLLYCKKSEINLETITSIQHWKWIPKIKELIAFLDFVTENNIQKETILKISRQQLWIRKSLELLKKV